MPRSRAASISAVSRSPAPRGCRYRWSVDVVQPDSASSARPTHADTYAASVSRARHSGYSDCSQPNKRLVGHRRVRPRQVLEEVVVRVDEARRDEAVGRVERRPTGRWLPVPTPLTRPPVTATQPPVEFPAFAVHRGDAAGVGDRRGRRISRAHRRGPVGGRASRRSVAMSSTVVSGFTMQNRRTHLAVPRGRARRTTVPIASSASLHAW